MTVNDAMSGVTHLAGLNNSLGSSTTNMAIIQYVMLFLIIAIVGMLGFFLRRFLNNLKKELDIDDLECKICDMTQILKDISSALFELIDKTNIMVDTLNSTKQFSNEEMYQFLTARFQLSIENIVNDFIDIVEKNNLFDNKDLICDEAKNRIEYRVYEGRDFLYQLNFDRRLLENVFNETDLAIEKATQALKVAFNDFYNLDRENVKTKDYEILKRKIISIGKTIRTQTDKMLRKKILGVNN